MGAWSVAIELHFYLMLPFLLLLLRTWGAVAVALTLVPSIILRGVLWYQNGEVHVASYSSIVGGFDQFVLGIVFSRVVQISAFRASAGVIFVATAVTFGVIWHVLNTAGGFYAFSGFPSRSPLWIVLPTIEGAAFGCLIAAYETMRGFRAPLLSAAIARVGEVSYSIYLTHYLLLSIVLGYLPVPGNFVTASFSAVLAFPLFVGFAMITYELFEKPFLKLRTPYVKASSGASRRTRPDGTEFGKVQ